MSESASITKEQIEILRLYEHTNDGRFPQGVPGASSISREYLEWRGTQYGTSFYSITDAGRAALKETPNA